MLKLIGILITMLALAMVMGCASTKGALQVSPGALATPQADIDCPECPDDCIPVDCDITCDILPDGMCLVTCLKDGEVLCQTVCDPDECDIPEYDPDDCDPGECDTACPPITCGS